MQMLAQTEGIFAETAGGVTIAALKKLAARGVFRRDEVVVALVTGNGLKTQEALTGHLTPAIPVTASLRAFEAALAELPERRNGVVQHTEEQKWLTSASSSPTLQRSSPSR
jgi:threonine synthase